MPGKDREERIRARAHELWELEGRPDGAGDRHWLQAAAEIDAKPAKAAVKKAAPKKAVAKPAAAKAAAKPAAAKAPAKKAPAKKAAAKK